MVFVSVCRPAKAATLSTRGAARAAHACLSKVLARRAKRLNRQADFTKVLVARHRKSSDCLHVNTHPSNHGGSRIGISVSRRRTGSAVQRNLVRRCLAEQFRLLADDLPHVDLVVTLRKPCTNREQARQVAREFKNILLKLAGGE